MAMITIPSLYVPPTAEPWQHQMAMDIQKCLSEISQGIRLQTDWTTGKDLTAATTLEIWNPIHVLKHPNSSWTLEIATIETATNQNVKSFLVLIRDNSGGTVKLIDDDNIVLPSHAAEFTLAKKKTYLLIRKETWDSEGTPVTDRNPYVPISKPIWYLVSGG